MEVCIHIIISIISLKIKAKHRYFIISQIMLKRKLFGKKTDQFHQYKTRKQNIKKLKIFQKRIFKKYLESNTTIQNKFHFLTC